MKKKLILTMSLSARADDARLPAGAIASLAVSEVVSLRLPLEAAWYAFVSEVSWQPQVRCDER